MIEIYHNTLPVCILPKEEHNVDIDYELVCDIVETLEPEILRLHTKTDTNYSSEWKNDKDDELITRWNKYNIFNIHHPALHPVFQVIMKGIKQFAEHMTFKGNIAYLQAWATATRKNSKVYPHLHNFKWVGHVPIRAEPSVTMYHWKNKKGEVLEAKIENKNGQLQLVPNVNHQTTIWEQDETRITIPFDVCDTSIWEEEDKDKTKPPMFPIYIE